MDGNGHFHDRDPITGRCPQCEKRRVRGYQAEFAKKTGRALPPNTPPRKKWTTAVNTMNSAIAINNQRSAPRSNSLTTSPAIQLYDDMDYLNPGNIEERRSSSPAAVTQGGTPIYIQIGSQDSAAPLQKTPSPATPEPPIIIRPPTPSPPAPAQPPAPAPPPTPPPRVIVVEREPPKPQTPEPVVKESPNVLIVEVPQQRPTTAPVRKAKAKPEIIYVERPNSPRLTPTTIRTESRPPQKKVILEKSPAPQKHKRVVVRDRPVKGRMYNSRNKAYLGKRGRSRCCCCALSACILGLLLAGAIAGLVYWLLGLKFIESIPTPRNWLVLDDDSDCVVNAATNTTPVNCMKTTMVLAPRNFTPPVTPANPKSFALQKYEHLPSHIIILTLGFCFIHLLCEV